MAEGGGINMRIVVLSQHFPPETVAVAHARRSGKFPRSDSWSIWQGDSPVDVVLRFVPEATQWVSETKWHPSARVTPLPGGGTEVRLRVASEVEMRPAMLRWTPYVEVVAPQSLRDYVAGSLRTAVELYGASNDGVVGTTAPPRRRR